MTPAYPLAGLRVALGGRGHASDYARRLLASLGAECDAKGDGESDEHPALAWRRSGLMALTGRAGGAARMCPVPLTACADGALAALAALGDGLRAAPGSGAALMGVRARFAGLVRQGDVSPGGTCRLLACRDGHIAVNLARPDDWAMVPAWLESDCAPDWTGVTSCVSERPASELLERARLLGLAVSLSAVAMPVGGGSEHPISPFAPSPSSSLRTALSKPCASPSTSSGRTDLFDCRVDGSWLELNLVGSRRAPRPQRIGAERPLVVDLSSLWAGPLCGQLLRELGAQVIKVESSGRPDGARRGPAPFFDLLNAGKASVQLDLASPAGRNRLRQLVERADVVIEASRPRALRQMGIHAEDWLAARAGRSWLSITGHGRQAPQSDWVAFGDDAGVGAGLSELMRRVTGERLICGDAIGDPLTGLHAALAAWASWRAGGGHLLALSLDAVLRHCVSFGAPRSDDALHERHARWTRVAKSRRTVTPAPLCFAPRRVARPLGADTAAVLSDLGLRAA